jgi:uncharacterized protein HemY
MTVEELTSSAERLSDVGRIEEALGLYRQWFNQPSEEKAKCAAMFNYGWLLQKLNLLDEAFKVQEGLVNAYASYIASSKHSTFQ